jgi:hypothetical protein
MAENFFMIILNGASLQRYRCRLHKNSNDIFPGLASEYVAFRLVFILEPSIRGCYDTLYVSFLLTQLVSGFLHPTPRVLMPFKMDLYVDGMGHFISYGRQGKYSRSNLFGRIVGIVQNNRMSESKPQLNCSVIIIFIT